MKNAILPVSAALAILLASPAAFANYDNDKREQKNVTSSSSTNAAGTTTATESRTEVDVDSQGNVSKTVKKDKVVDPEGLMNEKRMGSETTVKQDSDGYERTTTTHDTDAEGTSVRTQTTKKVDVDSDGKVIETSKTEKTVDPKGLLNQKTTTTESKTVDGEKVNR